MFGKLFGNTAQKLEDSNQLNALNSTDVETSASQSIQGKAVNDTVFYSDGDVQRVQSPTQDYRQQLEDKYQNHNIVKQNALLRAKVIGTDFPDVENEKSMRKVFSGVMRDFQLEDGDLSFEHFKLLVTEGDEKDFRSALIEAIPAEKLEQTKNMHPTKAEMKVIDGLTLEYEHADVQNELLAEMSGIDRSEADRYHQHMAEELKSPTDQYLEIEAELDEIGELEVQHEQVVQEVSAQNIGGSFDDQVAYLFDNPQAALDRAGQMMKADSKADAMDFVDGSAGRDALKGFDEGVGETFRDTEMKETISNNFEVLGEANMKGGQDLTGGDNDLRTSIKRDVARGSISQETIGLQASEEVGLDDEALARKAELEQKRDSLLEEHSSEIGSDIIRQRAELGLPSVEINSPESLKAAVVDMQAEMEKRKDMQVSLEDEMSYGPELSLSKNA